MGRLLAWTVRKTWFIEFLELLKLESFSHVKSALTAHGFENVPTHMPQSRTLRLMGKSVRVLFLDLLQRSYWTSAVRNPGGLS